MKQNVNFNIRTPTMFVFLVLLKNRLIDFFYLLNVCNYTEFYGPTITGASFSPTTEV
jgi:hypothetical protein